MSDVTLDIKNAITMPDIFQQYGFEPNRGGFITCPFHSEKTASLKTYDEGRRWKCFGCGEGGDVIRFVMLLFGIDFKQAVMRISTDFGIYAMHPEHGKREAKRLQHMRDQKRQQKEEQKRNTAALCQYHRKLWHDYLTLRPQHPDEPLHPDFVRALHELEEIRYRMEELQRG